MIENDIPRGLSELTGRHRCIGCLADVPTAEYLVNDFMCSECAEKSASYPLASTPGVSSTASDGRGDKAGGSP